MQLKKKVRGVRPIERTVEGRDDAEAEAIRGYCAAVRSALTDDGRPPLEASGLKLHGPAGGGRREPGPGGGKKGLPEGADAAAGDPGARAWRRPRRCGRTCGWPSAGCTARRPILRNKEGLDAAGVRRRYRGLIAAMRAAPAEAAGRLAEALRHFLKVTRSYWPGLFRCYDVGGPAADEQRPGAVLRLVPLPRAACQRPEGGLPGDGGAGLGAAGRGAATRLRPEEGLVLGRVCGGLARAAAELEQRRESRRTQRRFRRDPAAYLTELEQLCLQLSLPS